MTRPAKVEQYRSALEQVAEARRRFAEIEDENTTSELRAAEQAFSAAEEVVGRETIDGSFEANRQGVVDAKAELETAQRHAANIEARVRESASHRNPPVFDDTDRRLVAESRRALDDAILAEREARERFKAGVTPEQIQAELA